MTRLYLRIAISFGLVLPLACLWMIERSRAAASTAAPMAASSNLVIELDGMPNPVSAGDEITYSISVTTSGPDQATNPALSAMVPTHTTFVSATASSGWSCSLPPVGGTGTILCSKPIIKPFEDAEFTVVVRVDPSTPPGTIISFTANIDSSTSDPDPSNNSGTDMIEVAASPCAINCPSDITTAASATQCGAIVTYPVPTTTSDCPGSVNCTPPPGSFFPSGTSNVTCSVAENPQFTCSFKVTVVDQTPPVIRCPGNITTGNAPGQNSATVDYPIATASDACGVANLVCLPPSGSTFPLGTSTVTCTATDTSNLTASCFFLVTVSDRQAPTIRCPENVSMTLPATQSSAVVNYPAPTVSDNLPGVTVSCTPPSGSTFPVGTTTVTCAAVDASGNRSTCGFNVTLTGGPASLDLIIPNGQPNLLFATTAVRRKHRPTGPCAPFTIANNGLSRVTLSFDAILRTGSDVTSGRISDPREGDTYSLSVVNADGSERPLSLGDTVAIAAGGAVTFCLRFSPAIPPLAGGTTGLSAPQAIPDVVTSRINFGVAGGGAVSVNVTASVATAVQFINPSNPRKPPTFSFTKSGDEFTVEFAVYDPNMDVNRARYEFLDSSGTVVAGPFDVDLAQVVRDRNLVRGQSFAITQRFTGADSNPNVSAVRITVFDGETSVTSPTIILGTSAAASVQTFSRRFVTSIEPPRVRLDAAWR
ncbi:MAG TPA: HYR domain-containing protein [Blastocatellia bacterium]|nr:HYR domain-containing protein [Blastocatellia bacterium]